jgi:hypothetical protein
LLDFFQNFVLLTLKKKGAANGRFLAGQPQKANVASAKTAANISNSHHFSIKSPPICNTNIYSHDSQIIKLVNDTQLEHSTQVNNIIIFIL